MFIITKNYSKIQGKLEEALVSYSKAISIDPNYYKTYNNMGLILKEQGRLEQAIEAYKEALSINPDYAGHTITWALPLRSKVSWRIYETYAGPFHQSWLCWGFEAYFFPIVANASKPLSNKALGPQYPVGSGSTESKISKAVLEYKLTRGTEAQRHNLEEALELLSKVDDITIKNPTKSNYSNKLLDVCQLK